MIAPVLGQDDFPTIFAEALRMEEEKFNDLAGEYWMELHEMEPENSNINYRLGLSYLNSNKNKLNALKYFQLVPEDQLTKNYDYYNFTEKNAPIELMYYKAHAYHLSNMLDSAITVYNRFSNIASAKHYLRPEIGHQIQMCDDAKVQFANPKDYTITNLGSTINSEFAEFGPVISLDESSLFFTSDRIRKDSSNRNSVNLNRGNYYDDVYAVYKDLSTNQWADPELLSFNNVNTYTSTINVSPDGQQLFLFLNDLSISGVYETHLIGETWSEPEKFGGDINSDAWETHVALSADGNTMFFVSERSNGEGKRDIYQAVKLPNGKWSKALNLGDIINTEWDEEAPFIHPDGRTLYFSSKGHNSMGGYDIFYTTIQEDGGWSEPKNIGYPVNTTDDDIFFVTTADGKRAYYSSIRPGGYGSEDIYLIGLPENITQGLAVLKGFIYPEEGQLLPDDLRIEVTNISTGGIKSYIPRMRDGGYVIILPPCEEYEINYLRDDVSIHKENYFVPCESSYQEIHKEIYLNPLGIAGVEPISIVEDEGVGTVIEVNPIGTRTDKNIVARFEIFFDYNVTDCSIQRDDFMAMLKNIKMALEQFDYIEVTIEGSASKVPTKKFENNDDLARSRATDAENRLLEGLKMMNISSKKVRIVAINSLTQGPDYKGDAEINKSVYKKYQYTVIKAYH
jgi:hypothetical protein